MHALQRQMSRSVSCEAMLYNCKVFQVWHPSVPPAIIKFGYGPSLVLVNEDLLN